MTETIFTNAAKPQLKKLSKTASFLQNAVVETPTSKEWLEKRLEELAGIFAASVGGFSVMNN
jgi:hypothetical protein